MVSDNSLSFGVGQMSCASCVGRVEKALLAIPGVQTAQVNLASETARVTLNSGLDPSEIATALDAARYPAELQTFRFSIENMSCASCVGRVERALAAHPGIIKASVNLAQEQATVQALGVSAADIAQVATGAGFPARVIADRGSSAALDDKKTQEAAHLKAMTLLAAVLTAPVFILEMGSHAFPAMHGWVMNNLGLTLSWGVQFVLTTIVMAWPGRQFYLKGFPALFKGAPDMNSLVALGSTAAWGSRA